MKELFFIMILILLSSIFFIQIPICEKGDFFYKNKDTGECSLFHSTCDKKDNFIDCTTDEKIKTALDLFCKDNCDFSIINNKSEITIKDRVILETSNLDNLVNDYSGISFFLKLEDYKISKPMDYSISKKEDDIALEKSSEYKVSLFSEDFYNKLQEKENQLKIENKEFYISFNGNENEILSNFDFNRFNPDGIIISCNSIECTNISLKNKIIRISQNLSPDSFFNVFYSSIKNNCRNFQFEDKMLFIDLFI